MKSSNMYFKQKRGSPLVTDPRKQLFRHCCQILTCTDYYFFSPIWPSQLALWATRTLFKRWSWLCNPEFVFTLWILQLCDDNNSHGDPVRNWPKNTPSLQPENTTYKNITLTLLQIYHVQWEINSTVYDPKAVCHTMAILYSNLSVLFVST